MHLRQLAVPTSLDKLGKLEFTYSFCGPFTKNKEGIQKFKEAGD